MKNWQRVLEEFALQSEPVTWELPLVRLTPLEKFEAVQYLVEKGLVRVAGRLKNEHSDNTYEITDTGRFMWVAGFTEINRRKSPGEKKKREIDKTLAQRTVERAPVSVWDLARAPWRWSKKDEVF
jgi:hypothetical protein